MAFPASVVAAAAILAAPVLTGLSAAQAAEVPRLNVEKMCRDSAAADAALNFDEKRCVESELRTRDELAGQWASFPAGDRQQCTQLATLGGTASYVALITCLEMNRDARQARAGITSQPTNLRKPKP
jgi:hypothetical protein